MRYATLVIGALIWCGGVTGAGPVPVNISATSPDGSCLQDATGDTWRYQYRDLLPGGRFSAQPGELLFQLDLHSEGTGNPATYSHAWLGPDGYAELSNGRGVVRLALSAGDCTARPLAFNGRFVSGTGIWSVLAATGAYRQVTGNGTFTLQAGVAGSSNPFALNLDGSFAVLQPELVLEVARASWLPGSKADARTADVTYRIVNRGPGDAFAVQLLSAAPSLSSITTATTFPLDVGALASGASALVQAQYQITRTTCGEVQGGCAFDVGASLTGADALDVAVGATPLVRIAP